LPLPSDRDIMCCRAAQQGRLFIGLFGSYRRGTFTTNSDMDFLIVLERPSFDGYMDVKFFAVTAMLQEEQ